MDEREKNQSLRGGDYTELIREECIVLVTKETIEVATVGSTTEWISADKNSTMSVER